MFITSHRPLAKAIKARQREEGTVTVEGWRDDPLAAYALAKALAELPRLCSSQSIVRCVAAPQKDDKDAFAVHVWIDRAPVASPTPELTEAAAGAASGSSATQRVAAP
mmetsp:Transcript_122589/g.392350  ORF Transcript_122589/g.392350 Transcript_122589/m.392350 type:complete len:108 (+) Transcript_122589:573-896(+)